MKYLYGGIIILLYVLMIGFTFNQLPRKLQSIERHPYIVFQDENYHLSKYGSLWFAVEFAFIAEVDTDTGTKYTFSENDLYVIDDSNSILIYNDEDILIGSCDYDSLCVDHDLTDAYEVEYFDGFKSIATVLYPDDPIIFKINKLQTFLILETLVYMLMVSLLSFGFMRRERAKLFLSSLADYFEKIRFLQDVEHAKKRVIIAHRGSLILGFGILFYLIYVMIAIYTL